MFPAEVPNAAHTSTTSGLDARRWCTSAGGRRGAQAAQQLLRRDKAQLRRLRLQVRAAAPPLVRQPEAMQVQVVDAARRARRAVQLGPRAGQRAQCGARAQVQAVGSAQRRRRAVQRRPQARCSEPGAARGSGAAAAGPAAPVERRVVEPNFWGAPGACCVSSARPVRSRASTARTGLGRSGRPEARPRAGEAEHEQASTEAGILRAGPQVVHRCYVRLRDDEEVGAGRRPVIPESHQAQGCILAAHAQRCRPQCACFALTAVKRAAAGANGRARLIHQLGAYLCDDVTEYAAPLHALDSCQPPVRYVGPPD